MKDTKTTTWWWISFLVVSEEKVFFSFVRRRSFVIVFRMYRIVPLSSVGELLLRSYQPHPLNSSTPRSSECSTRAEHGKQQKYNVSRNEMKSLCDDTRDMIAIQFCDSFVVDGCEGYEWSFTCRSRVEEVSFTRHKSFLVSSNMRKVLARARLGVSKECRAVIMSGTRMTRHEKSSNPHLGVERLHGGKKKAKQIHVSIVVTYFFFNFKFDYNLCHQARRRCVWPENVNKLRRRRPIHTFIFFISSHGWWKFEQ